MFVSSGVFFNVSSSGNDPFFSNVFLLMHFDGANNSTIFTDVKGNTITRTNTPVISTTQSKFGGASGLFNLSTNDYLTVNNLSIGTNNFTIEFWVYPNTYSDSIAFFGCNQIFIGTFGGSLYFWQNGGFTNSFNADPTANVWNHIAVSRTSNVVYLFINGTLTNSISNNTSLGSNATAYIGNDGFFNKNTDGYIDDFRITNGVGRYTSSFTVPSSAYPDS